VLDMLSETDILGCRTVDAHIEANIKLLPNQGEILDDPGRYYHLVGKLNYLTVTRHFITFTVNIVSQFFSAPRTTHWDAVLRVVWYFKESPRKGLLYLYCTRVASFADVDWTESLINR